MTIGRPARSPTFSALVQCEPCRGAWLSGFLVAAILLCLPAPAAGQDAVYIVGSTGGRTKISGRILDYTGRELRLERPGGRVQSFPAERVVQIETQYGPRQIEADALFAKGRFKEALDLYHQARQSEPRRWVQRQISARSVWCYRVLNRPEQAGREFLLLIRDDPSTPHFNCIPLEWMPRQPSITLEQAARQWLAHDEPAAVLLGASHLLTTAARLDALRRLKQLAAGPDRRIAPLALAQTWRAEVVTATGEQIDAWGRVIDKLPESLAAGPYFVLGLARVNRQQWEQAALALLRVVILYPQQRALAAQSLLEAGRSLEMLNRTEGAVRLYRELIRTYREETRPVAEAQSRMEAMRKNKG